MNRPAATGLMLLAVVAPTAACVTPKKITTRHPLGTAYDEPIAGRAGRVALIAYRSSDDIHIRADRERRCTRAAYDVVEVNESYDLASHGSFGPGRSREGLEVAAGAAAGLLGVLALAFSSDRTWQERTAIGDEAFSCPIAASNLDVRIVLESGATVFVTTDPTGHATAPIPDDEPDVGAVVVHAGDDAVVIHYDRRRPRQVDYDAIVARPPPETAASLTAQARVFARAGDCASFRFLAQRVHALDRSYYNDVLAISADARACLQP